MNQTLTDLVRGGIAFAPVSAFLAGLIYLDSYKLVVAKRIVLTILAGSAAALVAFTCNSTLAEVFHLNRGSLVRYAAPLIEELLKAAIPWFLIRRHLVGFMVDAAIYGFAVGTGFALVENMYYLRELQDASIAVWLVRGFGTAILHGGTTAIFAVITKNLSEIRSSTSLKVSVPGLLAALVAHSAFNHFFLAPVISSLVVFVVFPALLMMVFTQSEKATRKWLGVGFDADAEILSMIISGNLSQTKVGMYLATLQERFPPEVVVDLLCYLRLYLELAIQAKGILMLRESGFEVPPELDIGGKFEELKFLETSIGKTGQLALAPFVRKENRELWQLQTLQQ